MKDNCLFCKIANKEIPARIIYENEYVMAFLDVSPVSNGHSLIIPKEHFDDYSQTKEPYLSEVNKVKQLVANQILTSTLKPVGINYLSNQNPIAGQSIIHYHEHIIPKYVAGQGFDFQINVVGLEDLDQVLKTLQK